MDTSGNIDRRKKRTDKLPTKTTFMESVDDISIEDDTTEAITVEIIQLLSVLCRYNAHLVTDIFPVVKRFTVNKFNEHILRTSSRHAPLTFLYLLQYCLDYNEVTTLFDIEPLFRSFFLFYVRYSGSGHSLSSNNGIFAYEVLKFCIQNKRMLLLETNVFSLYFPSLIKLVLRHPTSLGMELLELLPVFMSPSSLLEVFHTIVDMPLMASALEHVR